VREFFAEVTEGCDGGLEGLRCGEESLCFGLVLVYAGLERVYSFLLLLDLFEEEGAFFRDLPKSIPVKQKT
jgi:hypothetical protein